MSDEARTKAELLDELRQAREELSALRAQSATDQGEKSVRQDAVLEAVFESSPNIMIVVNESGRVERINRAGIAFAGRSEAQLLNQLCGEVVRCVNSFEPAGCWAGESCQVCPLRTRIKKSFQLGRHVVNEEERITVKVDAQKISIDILISTIPITIGEAARVLITMTDITPQKQVEEALQESEGRYRLLAENISDVIWVLDLETLRFTYASPSVERLMGYTVDEVLAKDVFTILSPTSIAYGETIVVERRAQFRPGETRYYTDELLLNRKDGTTVWTETTSHLALNETTGHIEAFGVSRNISARKQAETARRESEARYRLVSELISDFAYAFRTAEDGSTVYEWVTKNFTEIPGFSLDEIQAQDSLFSLVHPQDRATAEQHLQTLLAGQADTCEFRIVSQNGTIHWIRNYARPLWDEAKKRVMRVYGSAQEITARKRAEIILQARLRLMQFADSHALDELLTKTLDEVECLTDSAIGFYHFLEPDQKTISLQAWSTNTRANLCTAEGKGRHYDLDTAGVWVDCVHARRPVIHNDYASLPHRKGTPEGHAPVIREIVVPVLRGESIVAILGVGNKATAYNESDVEVVSFLADLAWDIAERKRSEEAIQQRDEWLTESQFTAHIGSYRFEIKADKWISTPGLDSLFGIDATYQRDAAGWINLVHPEHRAEMHAYLQHNVLLQKQPFDREYKIVRQADQQVRWMHGRGELHLDENGSPAILFGTIQDITEQKRAEEQIRTALSEKETLLRELYHRTKNNMQVITAMLGLEAESVNDEKVTGILLEMENRIRSMALVHQMLYQSQNLSSINLKEYIDELTPLLRQSYEVQTSDIHIRMETEDVFVLIDTAIPCGLIINELITNCLKHAFPGGREGEILIRLNRSAAGLITLEVTDNGVGMPAGVDIRNTNKFGLQTVIALSEQQLQGKFLFNGENGVACRIEFHDDLYQPRV